MLRRAACLLQICHIGTLPASSFWLLQTFRSAAGDAMLWPEVAQYWPEVASDLTLVTWSHATNSQADLAAALADDTMMIEADVSSGEGGVPIMAHPPAHTSDLTLQTFLSDVLTATADAGTKKGVKLDFKDISIVETSLAMIERMRITIPFWLNADVLRGPGNSGSPVDADRFLSLCQAHLPRATLSLGWTTTAAPGEYSPGHFADLKNLLDKYQLKAPVTLPLRASLAAESRAAIMEYLAVNPGTSLTIWSGKEDAVDLDKLVVLIEEVGKDRVYVDVPEDLWMRMASVEAEASGVARLG